MKRIFGRLMIAVCLLCACGNAAFAGAAENIKNTQGVINNLVVLVAFEDNCEYVTDEFKEVYQKIYNETAAAGVKKYVREISEGKLDFNGIFVPAKDSNLAYVKVDKKRDYYLPKHFDGTADKDTAYDGGYYGADGELLERGEGKRHIDGPLRENLLIREVVNKLADVDENINLDNDGDGYIDNITFIMSGNAVVKNDEGTKNIWGEVLWPHMTRLLRMDTVSYFDNYYVPSEEYLAENYGMDLNDTDEYGPVRINGKRVYSYNVLSSGYMFNPDGKPYRAVDKPYMGVICHELMHTLGLMDYYSYEKDRGDYQSIGRFDLMGSTSRVPQYMTSYLRKKMGWLSDENFMDIEKSGTYRLCPASSKSKIKAAVIRSKGFDTDEYFVIEARSKSSGCFDKTVPGTGIIIYRIDPSAAVENGMLGNMYGNDELYMFRLSKDGQYMQDADSGFLKQGDRYGSDNADEQLNTVHFQGTDNNLLKGVNSRITVEVLSVSGDNAVTFRVCLP